jgi:hypothetical protein
MDDGCVEQQSSHIGPDGFGLCAGHAKEHLKVHWALQRDVAVLHQQVGQGNIKEVLTGDPDVDVG